MHKGMFIGMLIVFMTVTWLYTSVYAYQYASMDTDTGIVVIESPVFSWIKAAAANGSSLTNLPEQEQDLL